MKTPKRYPATMSVYVSKDELYKDRARWKRKNRVKQFKHTIDKLTFENNIFKQTFIQNRKFLKELMSLICKPNRSTTQRLAALAAAIRCKLMSLKDYERKEQEYNRMFPHYPQTVVETHRFLTEAFGIPDETDGKEKQ